MTLPETRRRIMDAALACFLKDGYEQTTIARIRERSGASNGALFHHFPTKEAIADSLYVEAIASFQEGLWELLRSPPRSLRSAVRGAIAHQLRWTEEHPDHARFVYMRGNLEWDAPASREVAALNRDLAAAIRDWIAPLVARGEVRTSSILMITAIVSGPTHAIVRRWLAGAVQGPLAIYLDELADAAWAGLRGTPVPSRAARRTPVELGRVTLELLAGDGTVLAHGQATTAIEPESLTAQNHE